MLNIRKLGCALALLGAGYVVGLSGLGPAPSTAQELPAGLDQATIDRVRAAQQGLAAAAEVLAQQGKYVSITEGVNSYLVLSGGGNARQDLESGRGVDPETYAALYAGLALPEIKAVLGVDEQGRVTYNNEVVRMYSKSRLQSIALQRAKLMEAGL